MTTNEPALNDKLRDEKAHLMEILVGHVLRGGLVLSTTLIVVGLLWRGFATGHFWFDYTIEDTNFWEFLVADLRQLFGGGIRPRLLASLGIAVLLLTPYLRVVASLAFFAFVERDLKYSLITAFVLAVLTYSLLLR
jgi:uncharacterized membrane protein